MNRTSKSVDCCIANFLFLFKNENSKTLLLLYPTSHSLPNPQFKYTGRTSLVPHINKTQMLYCGSQCIFHCFGIYIKHIERMHFIYATEIIIRTQEEKKQL